MDWSTPLAPIANGLDGVVFVGLHRVSVPQTAGELHRRSGKRGSLSGIRLALERMRDEGLVTAQGIGNVVAYELNREHVAYPALTALLNTYSPYEELRRRLADLVAETLGPDDDVSVAIFGSVARMEAKTDSDVDILVVVTDDEAGWSQVQMALAGALHHHVGRWTGNDVQLAQVTWDGLRHAAQERDPFAISLLRDADTVVGESVRDFIAVAVGA